MDPLVSAIIPTTADRAAWIPAAYRCVQAQAYRNIELLIDSDPGTVGEKRNRLCERACGDIIAHFDSDDLSAPNRIADQVRALLESGKAVTGYTEATAHDNREVSVMERGKWRKTSGWWHFKPDEILGASLCYRRDWWAAHRFKPVNVGEDNAFIEAAIKADQAIATPGGLRSFCIRNHSGNVSGRMVVAGSGIYTEMANGGSFQNA